MYEDYMQNLLGRPFDTYQNMYGNMDINRNCPCYNEYEKNNFQCGWPYSNIQNGCVYANRYNLNNEYYSNSRNDVRNIDLEKLYPEIYNIIYPMIKKICLNNQKQLSSEVVDDMAREIYSNIETGNIINVDINVENSNFENSRDVEDGGSRVDSKCSSCRKENRQIDNDSLNDLIRILIIRELLDLQKNRRPQVIRQQVPYMQRPVEYGYMNI